MNEAPVRFVYLTTNPEIVVVRTWEMTRGRSKAAEMIGVVPRMFWKYKGVKKTTDKPWIGVQTYFLRKIPFRPGRSE